MCTAWSAAARTFRQYTLRRTQLGHLSRIFRRDMRHKQHAQAKAEMCPLHMVAPCHPYIASPSGTGCTWFGHSHSGSVRPRTVGTRSGQVATDLWLERTASICRAQPRFGTARLHTKRIPSMLWSSAIAFRPDNCYTLFCPCRSEIGPLHKHHKPCVAS